MSGSVALAVAGEGGDGLYLDEQVRVRQLVDGDRGAGGAVDVEVLGEDLVVAAEVVHGDQVGRDLGDVLQAGAHGLEDGPQVPDDGAGLGTDVQGGRAQGVGL